MSALVEVELFEDELEEKVNPEAEQEEEELPKDLPKDDPRLARLGALVRDCGRRGLQMVQSMNLKAIIHLIRIQLLLFILDPISSGK